MRLFLCAVLVLSMAGLVLAAAPSEEELQQHKPKVIQGGEAGPDRSVIELGVGGANNPPSDPPPKKGSSIAPKLDGVPGKDPGINQAPAPIPMPPPPDPPDDPEIDDARIDRN